MNLSGTDCARARESVSADLDRELHELDRRRLQAHLRVCADCSAWADSVTATTMQLREAAFEAPAHAAFEVLHHRRTRRAGAGFAVVPVAALLAGVVAVISIGGAQHGRTTTSIPQTDSYLVQSGAGIDAYGLHARHRVFQPV